MLSCGPVGVVVSSGGSVMGTAVDVMRAANKTPTLHVVTDRPCGAEHESARLGIPCTRIMDADRDAFSARAAKVLFEDEGCTWSTLFFARLVGAPLFDAQPCVNLHPSLLPSYPGLRALERLHADGGEVLGATAHRVDASVDAGPMLAQIAWPIPSGATLGQLRRWSFAQKLYLFLVLLEADGAPPQSVSTPHTTGGRWSAPQLRDPMLEAAYHERLAREGIAVPQVGSLCRP